jgi:hypothetical protein
MGATPAGEEIDDRDDDRQRRQDEYSVNRVHPVEGLPSAESGYIFITKAANGPAFDPPATA